MGLLERHGEVRAMVVPNTKRKSLQGEVYKHVEQGSTVYSDALRSYNNLEKTTLIKLSTTRRSTLTGKFITTASKTSGACSSVRLAVLIFRVEPFHLFRYLDEQAFRFNNRKGNDSDRFIKAAQNITGKRLTLKQLTGKEPAGYETSH